MTFMGGTTEACSDFLMSSSFPGFLGDALLGLSTLESLHSVTLLLLGVIVTVPGLSCGSVVSRYGRYDVSPLDS